MEQNNQNQFSDLSNEVESELQNGSIFFLNQIKNYNTLDKKIAIIKTLNLQDIVQYTHIINGIINGMLYDDNMSLENYFQFLFNINHDRFKAFIIKLENVISMGKLQKEKFDKIYQIFEKLIKINVEKDFLVDIFIFICRKFYPGQDLLNSIINPEENYDDLNAEEFVQKNTFYKFLNFIKHNMEFILEYGKEINLPGLVFIKVLRLLTESHVYQNNNNLISDNNNLNQKNSAIITNIVETYQKINFSEKIKKLISEIYDMQIDILTKIYTEKKKEIFSIGRELIRHIISIGKSNIEIINTIKNDLSENYEKVLSISNSINSSNIFTIVNIPPLMQKMINFILTSIKRSPVTYTYYVNWLFHKYKIENSIGNTLLVDITRYMMTNYYYYYDKHVDDFVPRWLLLGYLLKHIKNHIISSEVKQTIFLDLILFDKDKDSFYLIEPCLSCIIINIKDFPEISEELIEFLEHYVKHFDSKNVQKRINSICDAFLIFEKKDINNTDFRKLIMSSKMEEKFKNSFINLIKNEVWKKENEFNNNNNNNLINNNINTNIINKKNSQVTNNINNNMNNKDNNMNTEKNLPKDYSDNNNINKSNSINNNNNINRSQETQNNNNSNKTNAQPKQEKMKDIPKKINIDITISKEMTTYVQLSTLKSFVMDKSQKKFSSFLNELCKYNLKTYYTFDTNLKNLDPSYKTLCKNFGEFYIKLFKDELELKAFENFENFNYNNAATTYSYLFDYAFEKIGDNNNFQFIADLINKTIEIYPLLILHLIYYILINNFYPRKNKNNGDYINFFFLLNNNESELIKKKLNLFFLQCEENFLNIPLKFFFSNSGVEIFSKYILDDEHLIIKIIRNCDLICKNALNMSLISNKYILIDKKFFLLFKYSILFSPLEKTIFWNLVFSQGHIPSIVLEEFLINCLNILKNPPTNKDELPQINIMEFFENMINSIKILFKNEILTDINKGDTGLDNLSGKISHVFDFNFIPKNFIFILLDNFFEFYFDNKLRKKMFLLIVQKYYTKNSKNIMNLGIMMEFTYFFISECKRRYTGDKSDNNWISEDIKTIMNEIAKMINNYNNAEKH